ncbi:uncharacterized protein LOC106138223 [Amyelois transitella]|uniref:uncharacterized protein LOC106138223 n=1 Tax=Amyelois transitella TaxID=680683 RepID=UPI00299015BC|nr:uncharacterized protein LOC106138223 [Amyelois transitella]
MSAYLCLSGCISRAEKAGEARESIQTLLTVCAQLCHPCNVDIGSERQSATQSLRCALGTSMCGSRAEFCGLFARGAELGQSGGFVRAARTAHLLRAIAELDHTIVQVSDSSIVIIPLVILKIFCCKRAEFCGLFARGAELGQSGGFVRAARTAHLLRAIAELDHTIVQVSDSSIVIIPLDILDILYYKKAEFCGLIARGAELGQSGGFVRAARTAHLLRAIAELDHTIVQESFGEGGWPLEFRAAVARLLSQHAPSDKEAPRTTALRLSNQRLDQTLSETMVLDLIVLVGFVVVNNPQLQETICDGWSVIKTLCTLPANWLVSKPHSHSLLPTLIAVSDRESAALAIASELSVQMLNEYLDSPEAQKVKLVQVIKQGRAKKTGKK